MILRIIRTELISIARDRRSTLLVVATACLLFFATWAAGTVDQRQRNAHASATAKARDAWIDQGRTNAHDAGHFGDFVYRPSGVLSSLDSGVQAYTGKIMKVEAHVQDSAVHSSGASAGSLMRFGHLETSFMLQIILPLMTIFLGFGLVANERENGQLRLAILQGVRPRTLLAGKAIAIWIVSFLMLVMLVFVSAIRSPILLSPENISRLLPFVLTHLGFLWIVAAMTVACSAFVKTARTSLCILLVVWCTSASVLPPLTAQVAELVQPLPSRSEFIGPIMSKTAEFNSHEPHSKRARKFRLDTLKKYKVASVRDLPTSFNGMLANAAEEFGQEVWNEHTEKLRKKYERQLFVNSIFSFFNPLQAIDAVSMSLAGTDLVHDLDFQKQVSSYRLELMKSLNEPGHDHRGSTVDSEYLKELESFRYQTPTLAYAFWSRSLEWLALGFWCFFSLVMIFVASFGLATRSVK